MSLPTTTKEEHRPFIVGQNLLLRTEINGYTKKGNYENLGEDFIVTAFSTYGNIICYSVKIDEQVYLDPWVLRKCLTKWP